LFLAPEDFAVPARSSQDVHRNADEPNLARIVHFLRRRGIWILACLVLAGAAAFAASKAQTEEYTASAAVVFSSDQLSPAIAGLPALSAEGNALLRQSNNLELLYLGDAAEKTAQAVGGGLTAEDVSSRLKIGGEPESSIATIAVTDPSPELAARIANVYARQAVAQMERGNKGYYKQALKIVDRQLAKLPAGARAGIAGQTLENRAQSLQLLANLKPSSVSVAQAASVPTQPSSPKTKRNVAIGLLLGLVLGLGLALLIERLDRRVKTADELQSVFDYPLLGSVPESSTIAAFANLGGSQPGLLATSDIESLQLVRAHLRSLHGERPVRTVLVTSAAANEGKATIAVNLAAAVGMSGSRVLLLDANMRRSSLLGGGVDGEAEEARPTLPDLLRRKLSLRHGAQAIWVQPGTQRVVGPEAVAGGLAGPAEAVALLESPTMKTLLEEARHSYDLTLINAPSLTEVPDAFPLLPEVDAVIVVGYLNRASHEDAQRLKRVLEEIGAPVGGIVANGARSRGGRGGTKPPLVRPPAAPADKSYTSSA
jgi:tyrosine-protein kinase